MNLVFARFKKFKREESNFLASLRKLKKHGFNFLQLSYKSPETMNFMFSKLENAKKVTLIFCKLTLKKAILLSITITKGKFR